MTTGKEKPIVNKSDVSPKQKMRQADMMFMVAVVVLLSLCGPYMYYAL